MGPELFINERSLEGQTMPGGLEAALGGFIALVDAARARRLPGFQPASVLGRPALFYERSLAGQPLQQILGGVPKDLQQQFYQVVHELSGARDWSVGAIYSANSIWQLGDEDLEGSSVAELAARTLAVAEYRGGLLNFAGSRFGEDVTVSVVRDFDTANPCRVCGFSGAPAVRGWLDEVAGIAPYPEDATWPPDDRQTCLVDEERFVATALTHKCRQVYRELTTEYLYYVDDNHKGRSAELEVFDKRRQHLGTADIRTGKMDRSAQVRGRTLDG